MRIISGQWGGRSLPKVEKGVRPTPDRAREALFSILFSRGVVFEEVRALDLFCGSGAVGLELLSRGAQHVGFVDQARRNLQVVEGFLEKVNARDRANLVQADLPRQSSLLRSAAGGEPCDLVFADPPFDMALHPAVMLHDPLFPEVLAEHGLVIWEQESTRPEFEAIKGWEVLDMRTYGRIRFWFYGRAVA